MEKTPIDQNHPEFPQNFDASVFTEPADARPAGTLFRSDSQRIRSKSSQRIRYEAEVRVLKNKLGSLEELREKLGLSKRKVCQLLLVDPSAWTRWTKGQADAPPHIYRALQWYLALEEKYPALDVNFWLQTVARPQQTDSRKFEAELGLLRSRLSEIEAEGLVSMGGREPDSSLHATISQLEQKVSTLTFANLVLSFGLAAVLVWLFFLK